MRTERNRASSWAIFYQSIVHLGLFPSNVEDNSTGELENLRNRFGIEASILPFVGLLVPLAQQQTYTEMMSGKERGAIPIIWITQAAKQEHLLWN